MTRVALVFTTATLAGALATTPAVAVTHTVAPGETLWSISQTDGLSPAALAAANGLPPDAQLLADSTITIPAGGSGGAGGGAGGAGVSAGDGPEGNDGTSAFRQPNASGAYLVQPGDTLSAIAARAGVGPTDLAAANNLSLDGILPAGAALQIPGGQTSSAPAAEPMATPGNVTAGQIASIAAGNGVPASLAQAVAWQESGFNSGLVSSANAHGVMQIIPSTWNFIQSNLASSRLDPSSPIGNVTAGVLYLRYLLSASGGDPATAVAGYYQGLRSVRRIGILPETSHYVADVLALRQRFGGP